MEIAIALIGLVGAMLGLVAAVLSRRREVIHRHQGNEDSRRLPGSAPANRRSRPGALVLQSTLFGFAIGTFFGVTALGVCLNLRHWGFGVLVVGVVSLVACSLIGIFAGVRVGMALARLSCGENRQRDAEPTNEVRQPTGDVILGSGRQAGHSSRLGG
jgi:hypothetical protein